MLVHCIPSTQAPLGDVSFDDDEDKKHVVITVHA